MTGILVSSLDYLVDDLSADSQRVVSREVASKLRLNPLEVRSAIATATKGKKPTESARLEFRAYQDGSFSIAAA